MGAKGAVEVETLIAKNSVEEKMQELERGSHEALYRVDDERSPDLPGFDSRNIKEYQQAKTRALLQSLRLITDYHQFSKSQNIPDKAAEKRKCYGPPDTSVTKKRKVTFLLPDP